MPDKEPKPRMCVDPAFSHVLRRAAPRNPRPPSRLAKPTRAQWCLTKRARLRLDGRGILRLTGATTESSFKPDEELLVLLSGYIPLIEGFAQQGTDKAKAWRFTWFGRGGGVFSSGNLNSPLPCQRR